MIQVWPSNIWIQLLDLSDHRLIASSPRMSVQLNNLKNSFLCCKQSQEFSLMLQTISRIQSYAANNLKNSFLCCKQSQEFMICAANQSQEFFLACLCCKTISRILSLLLVLQNNLKISSFLACAANNLLVQIILEAYGVSELHQCPLGSLVSSRDLKWNH